MDLLNITEASEYLKIPVQSLRILCRKKLIPFHHIGNRVIFVRSELMDWIVTDKSKNAYTTRENKKSVKEEC